MFYKTELDFLISALKNMRLQTHIIPQNITQEEIKKYCTDNLLGSDFFFNDQLLENISKAVPSTIYRFSDSFGCSIIFMLLPALSQRAVFAVGPFLTSEITHQDIFEKSERLSLTPRVAHLLADYYELVPHLSDISTLLALIETFAQHIFKGENYSVSEISGDVIDSLSAIKAGESEGENHELTMRKMEQRYAFENELIQAVSHGLASRAEMLLSSFSELSFEKRLSDPLRNLKNYCIIMNTLLRKAVENGGVHPLYIDKVSSDFARRIELLPAVSEVSLLMLEMSKTYCRLVRKHSMKDYSPPIRKAIMYIDADLSRELSLSTLAAYLNLSGAYLSDLFKKETGKTVTEFINERRIASAKRLLRDTSLQIQTVAGHCGFMDVHYFSRVFKKVTGKTPREYRENKLTKI